MVSSSPSPPPWELDSHIERVLWTETEISRRVEELGTAIVNDFKDIQPPLFFIGVATGAALFLADLARKISLPVVLDFIRVKSYGSGTESNGSPLIACDISIDIKGKHVVVIEDIVDTGNTLSCLIPHLEGKGAASVSVCTFLDKPARRKTNIELGKEGKYYKGFECPDEFVVGYGMDYAGLYRNLPYIGILKSEEYK